LKSLKLTDQRSKSDAETGLKIHPINPFQSLTDADIWKAIKSGDQKALSYIYERHLNDLFRFGCQFTQNRDLIKDCIQDVFIAIGYKDSNSSVSSIKSYLFKSLYREIIRRLKRDGRSKELQEGSFEVELDIESSMVLKDHHREKLAKVQSGLKALSPKQRQVILHYYYDGLTYDEIAQVMGIQHKNTVAKLMSRAIEMLKQITISVILVLFSTF
tara:strand:+ start:5141 stop:5785 length:645 start_codon:yes stop_codon:yes gene_type:complete